MLRAQTRGNSAVHEVFVKKIAVVDLRDGRSDASETSRRWEAVAGTHAHFKSLDLECNKLIIVTSREVVWLFPEQLRSEFVPVLHRLQGRL